VVVPAAGATKLLPLASMLIGHGVEVGALLDGDEPARREGKRLVEKLLAPDQRCLFIGDFVGPLPHAEIEDVFPEEMYLSAVKDAYPAADLSFEAQEASFRGVVKKVDALFKRQNLEFEKWRPAAALRDRITAAPEKVPQTVCDVLTKVFEAVNGMFSVSGANG